MFDGSGNLGIWGVGESQDLMETARLTGLYHIHFLSLPHCFIGFAMQPSRVDVQIPHTCGQTRSFHCLYTQPIDLMCWNGIKRTYPGHWVKSHEAPVPEGPFILFRDKSMLAALITLAYVCSGHFWVLVSMIHTEEQKKRTRTPFWDPEYQDVIPLQQKEGEMCCKGGFCLGW